MLFPNILFPLLQTLVLLPAASTFPTQYILCSDEEEYFIKAAVAEARSLARAANQALDHPDVIYSESYKQWFGFENHGIEREIIKDNHKSLQMLSGRLIRAFPPINLAEIAQSSILYISVNASSSLCVDREAITYTNSEALLAPYSKFSSVLFLCPSFFALPITARLLDQSGAGKVILYETRHMSHIAALRHKSTPKAADVGTIQLSNTSTSCHSALCCSNLKNSEKYKNEENGIKFAIDAKYNPDLTQGNPCFMFQPAHLFRVQPRAPETDYASSLITSLFHQARSLHPRSVWLCKHVSTSNSVSYSISHSISLSVSHSYSMSVSHSVSMAVSYSLSSSDECSTTETSEIPYTYAGTTVDYTYTGTTVDYTYTGTTVDYTYIGTTVPYTKTSTSTLQMKKRTDEPLPSSSYATSLPGPLATGTSAATSNPIPSDDRNSMSSPTPHAENSIGSQHAITSKATPPITSTKTCIETTTFPARSFLPAEEVRRNGYIGSSQLNQLLQQITVAEPQTS